MLRVAEQTDAQKFTRMQEFPMDHRVSRVEEKQNISGFNDSRQLNIHLPTVHVERKTPSEWQRFESTLFTD